MLISLYNDFSIEKITKIYQNGIQRKAQPLERLKKYFNDFLLRRSPETASLLSVGSPARAGDKRQSWSSAAAPISCWATKPAAKRNIEVHGYRADMLEGGSVSFEEVRARTYRSRMTAPAPAIKLAMIDVAMEDADDDGLDDVPSLAVAVNPEDLTHISVYRDNTADLKELARMAAAQNQPQPSSLALSADKENVDVIMPLATSIEDEDDPFERIQKLEAEDCLEMEGAFSFGRRRKDRLSLIPEETESQTSHSLQSIMRPFSQQPSQTPAVSVSYPIMTLEERAMMESRVNPGLITGLLVVHESALAKVRTLEKTLGRDGTGGNQTVSALRIANGHFFIEMRIAPSKMFLAVDLEADVSGGRCNQWALKILSPPSMWEAFILSRLPKDSIFFPSLRACCHYNDVLFLTSTYYEQGTLSDALNVVGRLDELLVLFYTLQLLRMLSILIADRIVHTRITLDHLLLRSVEAEGQWTPQYHSDGSGGWNGKGLALTGFAKALDLNLLSGSSPSLDGSLTGHEHDMQAIARIITHLLVGSPDTPLAITPSHQFAHLWQKILSLLRSPFSQDIPSALEDTIIEVDSTLELASTQCSPSLKGLLTKLEITLIDS